MPAYAVDPIAEDPGPPDEIPAGRALFLRRFEGERNVFLVCLGRGAIDGGAIDGGAIDGGAENHRKQSDDEIPPGDAAKVEQVIDSHARHVAPDRKFI